MPEVVFDAPPGNILIRTGEASQAQPVRPSRGLPFTIRHLHKSFGDHGVLRGIGLYVQSGQFIAIVGRSGCGKSTLLRLIAGLETPDAGSISFGESLRRQDIRVMFQEPRLLPWARVLGNVQVGLGKERNEPDAQARADLALEEVGLSDRRGSWPAQLSGGQKQRVALARALVSKPRVWAMVISPSSWTFPAEFSEELLISCTIFTQMSCLSSLQRCRTSGRDLHTCHSPQSPR